MEYTPKDLQTLPKSTKNTMNLLIGSCIKKETSFCSNNKISSNCGSLTKQDTWIKFLET